MSGAAVLGAVLDRPCLPTPADHRMALVRLSARCPFARLGLDAIALSGCPGFAPEAVDFPHGPGASLSPGISCRHISVTKEGARHWPRCSHPDGPFSSESAATAGERK
jgi:hypothetical protein